MAADNKTLGRFELVGINPAPRGMPQVEVTFDIDANGIVNVSARDSATGKAQSIQIQASSGLSEADVERLVKEAEMNASQDQRKRALVEARNAADAAVYNAEKVLNDLAQIPETEKSGLTALMQELKSAVRGNDEANIRQLTDQLNHNLQQVSAAAYQAQTGDAGGTGPQSRAGASTAQGHRRTDDDDVVDAEFQEVA